MPHIFKNDLEQSVTIFKQGGIQNLSSQVEEGGGQ